MLWKRVMMMLNRSCIPPQTGRTGVLELALLILTLVFLFSSGQVLADAEEATFQMSLTHGHSCASVAGQVICWGSNHFGESDVPETLVNPYMVSIGGQDSCALDEFYVTCWGLSGFDIIGVNDATDLSRNVYHACVIDEMSLFCFGSGNDFGELDVPGDLVNPVQVAAGVYHTCALDEEGVKCWGDDSLGATSVPVLNSPTQITAGNSFTCALDADGVKCWGDGDDGILDVPSLVNPRQISAGYRHACALDDYGIQCWGANSFGQTDVPSLINPVSVAAGTHHSCALDDKEVICWGYNGWGQTEPDNDLIMARLEMAAEESQQQIAEGSSPQSAGAAGGPPSGPTTSGTTTVSTKSLAAGNDPRESGDSVSPSQVTPVPSQPVVTGPDSGYRIEVSGNELPESLFARLSRMGF